MAAVVAEEFHVIETVEPVGIVDHDRVGRTVAKFEEVTERRLDACHVLGDLFIAKNLAHFLLARGVADLGGAATHEHDGFMAAELEPAQQHDRHQIAHVEARRGTVVADVGHHGRRIFGGAVHGLQIGALVDKAARLERAQEFGSGLGHRIIAG